MNSFGRQIDSDFHKYPHTPHLVWLGSGKPRDDKVLKPSEVAEFVAGELTIEEKVDGANLGLSVGPHGRVRTQSRGNYLAPGHSHAQWNPRQPCKVVEASCHWDDASSAMGRAAGDFNGDDDPFVTHTL